MPIASSRAGDARDRALALVVEHQHEAMQLQVEAADHAVRQLSDDDAPRPASPRARAERRRCRRRVPAVGRDSPGNLCGPSPRARPARTAPPRFASSRPRLRPRRFFEAPEERRPPPSRPLPPRALAVSVGPAPGLISGLPGSLLSWRISALEHFDCLGVHCDRLLETLVLGTQLKDRFRLRGDRRPQSRDQLSLGLKRIGHGPSARTLSIKRAKSSEKCSLNPLIRIGNAVASHGRAHGRCTRNWNCDGQETLKVARCPSPRTTVSAGRDGYPQAPSHQRLHETVHQSVPKICPSYRARSHSCTK